MLKPVRTVSGYRRYAAGDVAVVQRIVLLNAAGLTLATIRSLLPCALPGSPGFSPCPALRDSVRQKLSGLDQQIAELRRSRALLASFLEPRPERSLPRLRGE